ncbi:class I SAM-dependent methyltransferase [Acuticoccus kandeliae]|uniref:class I SAM-dependent methyltransferase n=1 Tax=Acuticoccus kandeliae TaxID=2073160 RepID=UPI0013002F18|nr:class I SAM-dependent methyltransferase [Acuticoccus kandeliae]
MSGFSADWLALRADADARARADDLIGLAIDHARSQAAGRPVEILDLGAGTGATLRTIAPRVGTAQSWTLVDADPALLAEAERLTDASPPAAALTVETRCEDLTQDPAPWESPPDLVTASALFDITSAAFIEAMVARLAADRIALLAMLTYDGHLALSPAHPLDGAMIDAFNAHQRGEKSFGRAAGPDGADVLEAALARAGFEVIARETPWRLERAGDGPLIDATLAGWADAAREILPDRAAEIAAWLAARTGTLERLVVGHRDIVALPPQG